MKSYTQNVYTFSNGKRFIVREGSAVVWNGQQYVSKPQARLEFKALLNSGFTYKTDEKSVSGTPDLSDDKSGGFWNRYLSNWELNYGNS